METDIKKTYAESVQWARDFAETKCPYNIYEQLLLRIECLEGLLKTSMYYLANAEESARK